MTGRPKKWDLHQRRADNRLTWLKAPIFFVSFRGGSYPDNSNTCETAAGR